MEWVCVTASFVKERANEIIQTKQLQIYLFGNSPFAERPSLAIWKTYFQFIVFAYVGGAIFPIALKGY